MFSWPSPKMVMPMLHELMHSRLANPAQDLFGDGPRLVRGLFGVCAQILDQQHEFIAAQPAHDIHFADARGEPLGDFPQKKVAGRMAKRVVQLLEVVEIHEKQRPLEVPPRVDGHALAQLLQQQAPVGQPGQRVEEGQIPDLFLGQLRLRDVPQDGKNAGLSVQLHQRRGERPPEDISILFTELDLKIPATGLQAQDFVQPLPLPDIFPDIQFHRGLSQGFVRFVTQDGAKGGIDFEKGSIAQAADGNGVDVGLESHAIACIAGLQGVFAFQSRCPLHSTPVAFRHHADQNADDRKQSQRDDAGRFLGPELSTRRGDPDRRQNRGQAGGQQSGPQAEKQCGSEDCGIEKQESRQHQAEMCRQLQVQQQRRKNHNHGENDTKYRLNCAAHFASRHESILPEAPIPHEHQFCIGDSAVQKAGRMPAHPLLRAISMAEYMGAFGLSSIGF
jgi:hypothetical protein